MSRAKRVQDAKFELDILRNGDDEEACLAILKGGFAVNTVPTMLQFYACESKLPSVAMEALNQFILHHADKPDFFHGLEYVIRCTKHHDVAVQARLQRNRHGLFRKSAEQDFSRESLKEATRLLSWQLTSCDSAYVASILQEASESEAKAADNEFAKGYMSAVCDIVAPRLDYLGESESWQYTVNLAEKTNWLEILTVFEEYPNRISNHFLTEKTGLDPRTVYHMTQMMVSFEIIEYGDRPSERKLSPKGDKLLNHLRKGAEQGE
jgi:hypothetical protein